MNGTGYILKLNGANTVSIMGSIYKEVYLYGDHYTRGGEIIYGEFQLNAPALVQRRFQLNDCQIIQAVLFL